MRLLAVLALLWFTACCMTPPSPSSSLSSSALPGQTFTFKKYFPIFLHTQIHQANLAQGLRTVLQKGFQTLAKKFTTTSVAHVDASLLNTSFDILKQLRATNIGEFLSMIELKPLASLFPPVQLLLANLALFFQKIIPSLMGPIGSAPISNKLALPIDNLLKRVLTLRLKACFELSIVLIYTLFDDSQAWSNLRRALAFPDQIHAFISKRVKDKELALMRAVSLDVQADSLQPLIRHLIVVCDCIAVSYLKDLAALSADACIPASHKMPSSTEIAAILDPAIFSFELTVPLMHNGLCDSLLKLCAFIIGCLKILNVEEAVLLRMLTLLTHLKDIVADAYMQPLDMRPFGPKLTFEKISPSVIFEKDLDSLPGINLVRQRLGPNFSSLSREQQILLSIYAVLDICLITCVALDYSRPAIRLPESLSLRRAWISSSFLSSLVLLEHLAGYKPYPFASLVPLPVHSASSLSDYLGTILLHNLRTFIPISISIFAHMATLLDTACATFCSSASSLQSMLVLSWSNRIQPCIRSMKDKDIDGFIICLDELLQIAGELRISVQLTGVAHDPFSPDEASKTFINCVDLFYDKVLVTKKHYYFQLPMEFNFERTDSNLIKRKGTLSLGQIHDDFMKLSKPKASPECFKEKDKDTLSKQTQGLIRSIVRIEKPFEHVNSALSLCDQRCTRISHEIEHLLKCRAAYASVKQALSNLLSLFSRLE